MAKKPFAAEAVQAQLRCFRLFFKAAITFALAFMLLLYSGITLLDNWSFFKRLQPVFFSYLAWKIPFLSMVLLAFSLAAFLAFFIVYFKLNSISKDTETMKDGLVASAILEEYEKSNCVVRFWLESHLSRSLG